MSSSRSYTYIKYMVKKRNAFGILKNNKKVELNFPIHGISKPEFDTQLGHAFVFCQLTSKKMIWYPINACIHFHTPAKGKNGVQCAMYSEDEIINYSLLICPLTITIL